MPTANCDSPPIVDDNDLQNLDWLQNFNLMQTDSIFLSFDDCTNPATKISSSRQPSSAYSSLPEKFSSSSTYSKHRKPLQCTFNCMIFRAIEASPHKALQLHSIYDWIAEKHSYFKTAGLQWRNSVRHSLSLNKCFFRLNIDLPDESGTKTNRSSWWTVHPDFRNAYGDMVLDDGPTHRCLPRGVMTSAGLGAKIKRLSSSEHELAALANDIKAAAAILTLSRKNNNEKKFIDVDDDSKNSARKRFARRKKCLSGGNNAQRRKKNRQVQLLVAKNSTVRRNSSSDDVNMITVETQTDEIRIPQRNSDEDSDCVGSVKVEYILQEEICSNEEESTSNELPKEENEKLLESKIIGVVTRSRKKNFLNDVEDIKTKKTKSSDDVDICGAEFLLRLAEQKCPMDQELI